MSRFDLARARSEWEASRRLRLGVLAALLVLGAHAILSLSDHRKLAESAYDRDAALLTRLQEASREQEWPARADAAEARLAEVRHSVPPARSDGLAQAELQAWLTDLAAFAGMSQPNVRVETSLPVEGQDSMWQVLARLDGNLPENRIRDLARALAAARPWVQTERLEVQAGQQSRASLVVRGYFRAADERDASSPPLRPADLPPAGTSSQTQPSSPVSMPAMQGDLPVAGAAPVPGPERAPGSLAPLPSSAPPANTGSSVKERMRAEARARAAEKARERKAREGSP